MDDGHIAYGLVENCVQHFHRIWPARGKTIHTYDNNGGMIQQVNARVWHFTVHLQCTSYIHTHTRINRKHCNIIKGYLDGWCIVVVLVIITSWNFYKLWNMVINFTKYFECACAWNAEIPTNNRMVSLMIGSARRKFIKSSQTSSQLINVLRIFNVNTKYHVENIAWFRRKKERESQRERRNANMPINIVH